MSDGANGAHSVFDGSGLGTGAVVLNSRNGRWLKDSSTSGSYANGEFRLMGVGAYLIRDASSSSYYGAVKTCNTPSTPAFADSRQPRSSPGLFFAHGIGRNVQEVNFPVEALNYSPGAEMAHQESRPIDVGQTKGTIVACNAAPTTLGRGAVNVQRSPNRRKKPEPCSLSIEDTSRITRAHLWGLSAQHIHIQESERSRIASELHDGLGQTLTLLRLSIETAAATAGTSSETAMVLQRLSGQVRSAVDELRRIAMNLRPATLDQLGIVATLAWHLREAAMGCPQIELEGDVRVQERDVPEPLKMAIFRIVQEATTNAIKYAEPNRIKVGLTSTAGVLELSIEDNGRGMDPSSAALSRDFKHGLGLQTMKERAELTGGKYELQSAPGKGTKIRVSWPGLDAGHPKCPVIPISQTAAQSMCMATINGREVLQSVSGCLTCLKDLAHRGEQG